MTDAKAIDSLIGDPRRRALMKEAFDEATGPLASEPTLRRTKSATWLNASASRSGW